MTLFNVRSAGTEFAREAMAPPAVPAIKMAGKRFARYPVPIVLERQQRAHNRFGSGDVAQERTLRTARALRRGVPLRHRATWESSGAPCRGLLHSDTRRAHQFTVPRHSLCQFVPALLERHLSQSALAQHTAFQFGIIETNLDEITNADETGNSAISQHDGVAITIVRHRTQHV